MEGPDELGSDCFTTRNLLASSNTIERVPLSVHRNRRYHRGHHRGHHFPSPHWTRARTGRCPVLARRDAQSSWSSLDAILQMHARPLRTSRTARARARMWRCADSARLDAQSGAPLPRVLIGRNTTVLVMCKNLVWSAKDSPRSGLCVRSALIRQSHLLGCRPYRPRRRHRRRRWRLVRVSPPLPSAPPSNITGERCTCAGAKDIQVQGVITQVVQHAS